MEIFNNFKDLFLSVWNRGILGIDIFENFDWARNFFNFFNF